MLNFHHFMYKILRVYLITLFNNCGFEITHATLFCYSLFFPQQSMDILPRSNLPSYIEGNPAAKKPKTLPR